MSSDYHLVESAQATLAGAPTLLVALDFDGTLAPLVDNPDLSRMTPEARAAVLALTDSEGVSVALVSGRGLANLREVSEADPRWWLIGSHGIELEGPANGGVIDVPTADPDERQALWDDFTAVAERFPGTWVERKPWGAALHTRGLDTSVEDQVRAVAKDVIGQYGDALTTRLGHGMIESSLQNQTKGDGVRALVAHLQPERTLFIGDDLTDEDAIAALGEQDVGIHVGDGPSMANLRLDGVADVAAFLFGIAVLRQATP